MMTKLMTKLYSEENEELRTQVADKVEEAKANGSSELITDDENLQFADTGDGVIVEDQANDNEVTMIKEGKDGDDYNMEAVDVTAETKEHSDEEEDPEVTMLKENADELAQAAADMEESKDKEMAKAVKEMSQKLFSDCEELEKTHEDVDTTEIKEQCNKFSEIAEQIIGKVDDVKTDVVEGKDGDHITDSAPEVKVEVTTGINDKEKAGLKNFSLTFSGNCDPAYIASVSKAFADIAEAPKAEPATEPENKENEKLDKIQEDAAKIEKAVAEMGDDKAKAQEVKAMCSKLMSDIEEVVKEDETANVDEIKEQCSKFSASADEVINKVEEVIEEVKKDEKKDDEKKEETEEEKVQKNFSSCLSTSFNGIDVAPKFGQEKVEQKVFSEIENKEGYANPCLMSQIM